MKTYTCYFDGSCEPTNPGGSMGCGIYITDGQNKFKTSYNYPPKPDNTNNVAEYLAFIGVMKLMKNKIGSKILILGDSKLVITQMSGIWKIKKGAYTPFAQQAQLLLTKLKLNNTVILQWIPREQNEEADNQSKAHLLKNNI